MSFAKIRPRRGTANQWNNANPILAEGEIGIEVPSTGVGTGTVKIKFGDGSSHWNDLPYGIDTPNDVSDVISDEFIAGTPCTSGNYYIANNKLYKCIADTDGSINVTNSNYFEETSVAGEVKALNGKLVKYIDITANCPANTWCNIPLPDAISHANKVINVIRANSVDINVYGIIWWPFGSRQITILRINTNGTNLTIDNTEKTIKLRIWFC